MLKNKKDHLKSENTDKHQSPTEDIDAVSKSHNASKVTEDEKSNLGSEDELKAEAANWNDKYIRLYAEFDNFKRRTLKERVELIQTSNKDVMISLIPVLDDFDRAIKSIETTSDITSIKEGVALIQHKLKGILSQKGLKEMESKGKTFDADLHEGIANVPTEEDNLKGKVVDELEKGYFLNDKVIRFAKVIIGV